jgi:hypothetical protein
MGGAVPLSTLTPGAQMNRTVRVAVGALATLALAGVGSGAEASSVSRLGMPHHQVRLEHDGSTHVLRALGRIDRRLDHATRAHRLAPLTDSDRAALRANVAADEATVEAVATAYSVDPTNAHLAAAKGVLTSFRAQRYVGATNILRHSEHTAAAIATLESLVVPGGTDETDLAAATGLLAGLSADAFTATTPRTTMKAARHAVARARGLVGHVRDDLAVL